MKKFIVLLFLFPVFVNGQDYNDDLGVKFERDITFDKWKSIAKRAKSEGKYIFLLFNYGNTKSGIKYFNDYYNIIFADKLVSSFVNSNFISVLVQKDYDKNANPDANAFFEKLVSILNVKVYPSYLFFDEEENLVHRFTSWNYLKSNFLEQSKLALDKEQRFYALIEKFENGNRDTAFLKQLFNANLLASDSTDKYVLGFIKSRDNLFTKENADILMHSYSHIVAFDYLYSNQEIWKKIIDGDVLENFYKQEIRKQISETYYNVYNFKMYADDLIRQFDSKYPKYGKEASVKFLLWQWVRLDDGKNPELNYLVKTYIDSNFIIKLSSYDLNSLAWFGFVKVTDNFILNQALSWSKKSLELDKDNPAYLDTYANLLYKLGQIKEAIEIETKALELVKESEKKSYQETLDKMKAGKPTWK